MPRVIIVTKDQAGEVYSLWRAALMGAEKSEWEQRHPNGLTILSCLVAGNVEMLRERTEEDPSSAGDLSHDISRYIGTTIKDLCEGERVLIAAHGATYDLVRVRQQPGKVWVQPLTHEGGAQPYEAVLQYVTTPSIENFQVLCESIKSSLSFDKRVCNVQHSLTRLFSALALDLEVWRDEGGTSQEAWDVFRNYSKGSSSLLKRARSYIYGPAPKLEEAIADIIAEARIVSGSELTPRVVTSLDQVHALVPLGEYLHDASRIHQREHERAYSLFINVFGDDKILDCIKNIAGDDDALNILQSKVESGNPVQEWLRALNDALDELRKALISKSQTA